MQDTRSGPARITTGGIDVGGRRRTYTLAVPAEADPERLLLVLHGSRQTGRTFRAATGNTFDAPAADGRTVVAYLDGHRRHWNDARRESRFAARTEDVDDVGFAVALIDLLVDRHGIDREGVYAAGYSNGGQMAMRLIHEIPERLAGVAVLAATQPVPEDFLLADAPTVPRPVLLIHGTRDPIVPYGGGEMRPWVRAVFRIGGSALSAPETAAYYAARNGITQPPTTSAVAHRHASDRTRVVRTDHRRPGAPPVTLYSVHGGGHTVPGSPDARFVVGRTSHDLNAAQAISAFFDEACTTT